MEPLEYQLTEEDLVRLHMYYFSHITTQRKRRQRKRYLISGILLFLAVPMYLIGESPMAVVFVFWAVVWFLFYPPYIRWLYRNSIQRSVHETRQSLLAEPITLAVEDDGIYLSSAIADSRYRYSAIECVVEHAGYNYIFLGKAQALILPHDRLGKEAVDAFVAEVEQRREVPPGASTVES